MVQLQHTHTILIIHRNRSEIIDQWGALLPEATIKWAASPDSATAILDSETISAIIAEGHYNTAVQLDTLAPLLEHRSGVPILVVSRGGDAQIAVAALHAGVRDYLVGPVSAEQIQQALRRAGLGQPSTGSATIGVEGSSGDYEILTQDPGMQQVLDTARRVADSDATVLILGESGTGKELMARYVHQEAAATERPLVALNCAALPETLAESELFGHERGAFTGAVSRKLGRFEQANGGTLILDEISEMPLPLQAKLLRALQERVIDRVGGTTPIPVSVRVIAISNVDLRQAVDEGRFRKDLYYRINVIPLVLPPLRQRADDIPLLVDHFMTRFSRRNRRQIKRIDPSALDTLSRHSWDGNIRELENTIERAVLVSSDAIIRPEHLMLDSEHAVASSDTGAFGVGMTVRDMEQTLIHQTMAEVNDNRTMAAEMLGISIRTLRNKLKEIREQEAA